jgi:threonine/homoserine/homoserine lactone efflux protein
MTTALLAFALTATLLILAPGPDRLLVMHNTLRGGRRAGWITACGTMSGLLVWAVAVSLGLSALLRVSRVGCDILRLAGAAYLIWLGASSLWRLRRGRPSPPRRTRPAQDRAPSGLGRTSTGGYPASRVMISARNGRGSTRTRSRSRRARPAACR